MSFFIDLISLWSLFLFEKPNNLFKTPDKIDINEKIQIELNPFRDFDVYSYKTGSEAAWSDIVIYEKIKPGFVYISGWIMVSESGQISYPDCRQYYCTFNSSKFIQYSSKFKQCRWDIGFILYMNETFDNIGGKRKDIETFYHKLLTLNISFI